MVSWEGVPLLNLLIASLWEGEEGHTANIHPQAQRSRGGRGILSVSQTL